MLRAEVEVRQADVLVRGVITAADVVHHMAYHHALHLAQIARMLARPAEAARGNMRQLG